MRITYRQHYSKACQVWAHCQRKPIKYTLEFQLWDIGLSFDELTCFWAYQKLNELIRDELIWNHAKDLRCLRPGFFACIFAGCNVTLRYVMFSLHLPINPIGIVVFSFLSKIREGCFLTYTWITKLNTPPSHMLCFFILCYEICYI